MVNRLIARNLAVLLFLALPVAICGGAAGMWMHPPAWAGSAIQEASFGDFASGATFWYILLFLPTVAVGLVHQVVMVLTPHDWSERRMRAALVGTAVLEAMLIAAWVGKNKDADVVAIVAALLPAVLVYTVFARPLWLPNSPREPGVRLGTR